MFFLTREKLEHASPEELEVAGFWVVREGGVIGARAAAVENLQAFALAVCDADDNFLEFLDAEHS